MLDWLENNKYIDKIIRFWLAGTCCFFIMWGTYIGKGPIIDALFYLTIAMGCVEMFVTTPLIRFIEHGENLNKNLSILDGVIRRLKIFLKTFLLMVFIVATYWVLNKTGQFLLGTDFKLLVDPILFGILYTLYFHFWRKNIKRVKQIA